MSSEQDDLRVLVVDDDPRFRQFMEGGLVESGLACDTAASGDEALQILEREARGSFDAILLDVMMPGRTGWEVLEEIRAVGDQTPVLFLTARHAVEERVKGLKMGADDYVIKPFELAEVLARIEAVVRRKRAQREIVVGDLQIDVERHQAKRAGRRIEMSPREFELLLALGRAQGRVLSRSKLLHEVWGIDFDPGTNVVNVQVARLRRKLDQGGSPLIHTIVGEGYVLSENPPESAAGDDPA